MRACAIPYHLLRKVPGQLQCPTVLQILGAQVCRSIRCIGTAGGKAVHHKREYAVTNSYYR